MPQCPCPWNRSIVSTNSNTVKFYSSCGLCFALYGRSARLTNKQIPWHHCVSLRGGGGDSHRCQEGGLLLVGQRTKEQQYPSKRAEEMLPESTEAQLTHHCTTRNGWEGTAANTVPVCTAWTCALSRLCLTGDRGGAAHGLRRRQPGSPQSSIKREAAGPAPRTSLFIKSHFKEWNHWQTPIITRDNFNTDSDSQRTTHSLSICKKA